MSAAATSLKAEAASAPPLPADSVILTTNSASPSPSLCNSCCCCFISKSTDQLLQEQGYLSVEASSATAPTILKGSNDVFQSNLANDWRLKLFFRQKPWQQYEELDIGSSVEFNGVVYYVIKDKGDVYLREKKSPRMYKLQLDKEHPVLASNGIFCNWYCCTYFYSGCSSFQEHTPWLTFQSLNCFHRETPHIPLEATDAPAAVSKQQTPDIFCCCCNCPCYSALCCRSAMLLCFPVFPMAYVTMKVVFVPKG